MVPIELVVLMVAVGVLVIVLLTVLDALEHAPYQCEECDRTLDEPECPVCDDVLRRG